MNPESVIRQTEKAYQDYEKKIETLAIAVFEQNIIPLCKLHNLGLATGNGGFVFYEYTDDPNEYIYLDPDKDERLDEIRDIINIYPEGINADFMSFMPHYPK